MELRPIGKTGLQVTQIGFGASPLGDAFGSIDPREAEYAVHEALDRGINFFDVSPYYGLGLAETRLGGGLAGRRDEVVLSTKCGRYGAEEFDFSPARIRRELEASLHRLQTDRVDILLAHDIEFGDLRQIVNETIPCLRALQLEGKARFIGASGYPIRALAHVMTETEVDVVLTYCRYNLLNTDFVPLASAMAREHGTGVLNASPLHMGILGGGPVAAWHPADEEVRRAGAQFAVACREYGMHPAAVALRFCVDSAAFATTLVGISSAQQVADALDALETTVPAELQVRIDAILEPVRGRVWASGRAENN